MLAKVILGVFQAAVGAGVGYALYYSGNTAMGQFTWILTALLTLNRVLTTYEFGASLDGEGKKFTAALEPVGKLAQVVDLSVKSDVSKIETILDEYLKIRAGDLNEERDRVVDDAIRSLRTLRQSQKTSILEEPDFYQLLYREFRKAGSGTRISIVSMGDPLEWKPTPQEETYFQCNIDAASRGAIIERIFLFTPDNLEKARDNKYIKAHAAGSGTKLNGKYIDRADFERRAPRAFRDAGQGFIVIDRRIGIVDVFSTSGEARGYATYNEADILTLRRAFEAAEAMSGPLVLPPTQP